MCSFECEPLQSDSLADPRGADEESKLSSVLKHLVASECLCQPEASEEIRLNKKTEPEEDARRRAKSSI
jgi:hypothetical protein